MKKNLNCFKETNGRNMDVKVTLVRIQMEVRSTRHVITGIILATREAEQGDYKLEVKTGKVTKTVSQKQPKYERTGAWLKW
jgi:hypothetical protein